MAYQKLDTRIVTLTPKEEAPPEVGWVKLDTQTITLSPKEEAPPPGEWLKLDTQFVTLTPAEAPPPEVGWVKLATSTITLTPTEAPPVPPGYELIQHTEYPAAKTHVGKAEQCTFEFKLYPEQIPGVTWLGIKVAIAFADKVADEGAEMLDLKVYEDTTPMFWTNYRVVATATASPVPWALIIVAVLAILFFVALTFLIKEVKTIDWGEPMVKAAIPIIAIIVGGVVVGGIALAVAAKKKEVIRRGT